MTTLQIIYEDAILLVCNKPAGLMVEPDRNNHPNLLQQVKNYLKEKEASLRRLNRKLTVAGVIVSIIKYNT